MRGPQPWKTNRSRMLTSNASSAENILWHHLRNRNFNGFKFVRQAPIANYFADFLSREAHLIIEVDGGTHAEPHEIAADLERTRALEELGYKIVRVHNADIYENIEGVLQIISSQLETSDN